MTAKRLQKKKHFLIIAFNLQILVIISLHLRTGHVKLVNEV